MQDANGAKGTKRTSGYTWKVPADLEILLDEVVRANRPFASRSQVMRLALAQGLAVLKDARK